MASADEVKIIKASTELQRKIGTGVIDTQKIDQAQKVIDTNKVDFGPIAKPFMEQLAKAIAAAKHGVAPEKAALESLMTPIMNLKANAATFNFPLISEITGTVLNFMEHVGRVDADVICIADNLHKAVTVAVVQKLSKKETPLGMKLIDEFRDVCRRYMEKRL